MEIQQFTGGPVDTHGYLVFDLASGEALVVDAPLDTAAPILAEACRRDLRLLGLVLTHGHFDHLLDIPAYAAAGVPVMAHAGDRPLLAFPQPALFGLPLAMPHVPIDRELAEGDELLLGSLSWQVLHTPGHSPGGISLYAPREGVLFPGDVLFAGGMGRTDLPGADALQLYRSLARLADLPPETIVYPGHGPRTTIGAEQDWIRQLAAP
ncbi:MAG: MBL fold metallo-hydrolase [Armatimonadetes bacterium]|nr:MBL fold metallo-hydrolase [Armatimonadota bacterium]